MTKSSNVTEDQCEQRMDKVFTEINAVKKDTTDILSQLSEIKGRMSQNWLWTTLGCSVVGIVVAILTLVLTRK